MREGARQCPQNQSRDAISRLARYKQNWPGAYVHPQVPLFLQQPKGPMTLQPGQFFATHVGAGAPPVPLAPPAAF